MPANEAIRRIRHVFSAEGADKVVTAHERVAQSQREIVAASSATEKATFSLDRQFANIERRYNATVRAQQDYERVQRQVNAAVAQNPELQQRANSVLALAEQRYRAVAAANDNFTAAQRRNIAETQRSVGSLERLGRAFGFIRGLFVGQVIGSAIGGAVDILSGKKFIEATIEQEKALAQLQARLASTGGAAGMSSELRS
jgi:DNA repair exonuclease SbcCD ATPase subunit